MACIFLCGQLQCMAKLHATLNYKETVKYCNCILLGLDEGDEAILQFVKVINEKAKCKLT